MSGTRTGTGGFKIDDKTYVVDVADPGAAGPDPVPTDVGDLIVDKTAKDVSRKTKTTLAQYMSDLTTGKQGSSKGTPNAYPVDAPKNPVVDVVLSDEKGFPSAVVDTTNSAFFALGKDAKGVVLSSPALANSSKVAPFSKTPDSVMPGGVPDLTLAGFAKGKSPTTAFNGNYLLGNRSILPTVDGASATLPDPLKTYTSNVLKYNRWTTDAISSTQTGHFAPAVDGITNDSKPGEFNPVLNHPRFGAVSLRRLAQIGTALSLRASQELNSSNAGNNPTNGAQEGAALLPSANQLGTTRVDAVLLEARSVLETMTTEEIPNGTVLSLGDVSWGSLNNVDDQFSGIDSLGMIGLASALTAAIVVLFEGLGFLLGIAKTSSTGPSTNLSGRYVLGMHSVSPKADPSAFPPNFPPDIASLLGIRPTDFPLSNALEAGVASFFGIDTTTLGSALTSGLTSATSSPGFNVVVARTIIRSSSFVVDAFKKAFASSNIVSGISNVLNIIGVIRSSKLISAINVFATLGDKVLTDVPSWNAIDAIPEEPNKKSKTDAFTDDSSFSSVTKSRMQASLKLAWSSNRSPSMYLIPDSVLTMHQFENQLGGFKGITGLTDPKSKTVFRAQKFADQVANGARIPYDDGQNGTVTVKNIEAQLDAEYVPFYFHDLRTNEIISFHAFLASLSDDYTPSWENTDGFGRVDPVKIYKNTVRKIGLSFYVVATSEADFDDMWMKINKLVTLVYPQYSQGRVLTDGSQNTFIQPFSQTHTASPLIRIRLGDLLRSNYSKFALARLFGAASNVMTIDGQDVRFNGVAEQIDYLKAKTQEAMTTRSPDHRFTCEVASGWKLATSQMSLGQLAGLPSASPVSQAKEFNVDASDLQYFEFEIKSSDATISGDLQNTSNVCIPHLMTPAEMHDRFGIHPKTAMSLSIGLNKKYGPQSDNVKQKVIGQLGYTIPAALLKPTRKTIEKIFKDEIVEFIVNGQTISNSLDYLAKFLSSKDNALAKSFESVQGKGLAGAIESMNFDWYDKTTWDTGQDRKAPKMCKVTIAFAPIHDISPGIDHLGYNRAPLYPVGAAMRGGDTWEDK